MMDVVVTGMGTLGPWGAGEELLHSAMVAGEMPQREVDESLGFHRSGDRRQALLVPSGVTREWIPMLAARRMSLPSRLAVSAARMALIDAGLGSMEKPFRGDEGTAVVLGNAWGSTDYTQRMLEQLDDRGPEGISPYLFMETVANAPAGQVALSCGAQGSNTTFTMREASDIAALGRAASLIRSGRATRVLAGGVGEISSVLHGVLARYGALSKSHCARPFDADADGVVPAEGATVWVMESAESAEERGAPVRCRVSGYGRATDVTATATDWGTGAAALGRQLTGMFGRFGMETSTIDLVISGASGAPRGDQLERGVLTEVFGENLPQVLAPKAVTGEYGGTFLAGTLWSLTANTWPRRMMPLGSTVKPGGRENEGRRALVTSTASGGPAAWVVLDQP